jgi:Zn-dependent protease with chaperone function
MERILKPASRKATSGRPPPRDFSSAAWNEKSGFFTRQGGAGDGGAEPGTGALAADDRRSIVAFPPTAFTLPGRYLYITRRFIERCTSDAPVAFALAHEIGHHDLGHLRRAERWMDSAFAHVPADLAFMALEGLARWLYSRDNELAADAYALDLCRKAGFDPKQCLQCFDILTWYMLDMHDLDGVYGTDEEIELDPEQATNSLGRISSGLRLWRARHRRSHPSLHERRQILLSRIADTASDPSITELNPASAAPDNHRVGGDAALGY